MELRQIRYFLALCDERNFTRAARRCRVAQPSLTNAIRKLERELGDVLFHRARSNTELSELGLLVKPCFLDARRAIEQVMHRASDFAMRKSMSTREPPTAPSASIRGRPKRRPDRP
jgi:DNA-binding transcriptional LysR family regulator